MCVLQQVFGTAQLKEAFDSFDQDRRCFQALPPFLTSIYYADSMYSGPDWAVCSGTLDPGELIKMCGDAALDADSDQVHPN